MRAMHSTLTLPEPTAAGKLITMLSIHSVHFASSQASECLACTTTLSHLVAMQQRAKQAQPIQHSTASPPYIPTHLHAHTHTHTFHVCRVCRQQLHHPLLFVPRHSKGRHAGAATQVCTPRLQQQGRDESCPLYRHCCRCMNACIVGRDAVPWKTSSDLAKVQFAGAVEVLWTWAKQSQRRRTHTRQQPVS